MSGIDVSEYHLPEKDTDLLSECTVTTCRSGGKGGQHVNKTDSAVRLYHIPSGIAVRSDRERSQYLNKTICLSRLRQKLQLAQKVRPKRVPTSLPRSIKRKRASEKQRRSEKKAHRRMNGSAE